MSPVDAHELIGEPWAISAKGKFCGLQWKPSPGNPFNGSGKLGGLLELRKEWARSFP